VVDSIIAEPEDGLAARGRTAATLAGLATGALREAWGALRRSRAVLPSLRDGFVHANC
jgi:hypothetical protein